MKNVKRLLSLALALMMLLSLATTAFATQEGPLTGGSITINNAADGHTYSAYQILYLESYDAAKGTYAYKANSAWAEWLATQTDYVAIDAQGYVTWVQGASAAEFADLAQTQLSGKTADAAATASGGAVTLSSLKLGYYLVDTTLGALCSLDTTNPNVEMEEKNEVPKIIKEVKEDSTNSWGHTNDADINQVVEYKATITVEAGAENYVMYDNMSEGLTWDGKVKVTVNGSEVPASVTTGEGEEAATVTNWTLVTQGTELTQNAVTYDFAVKFENSYIDTLAAKTEIVITYSATLNESAVIGVEGNPNDVILKYGDENHPSWTPKDITITYTWDMEVLKYANGDKTKVLAGVKFVLLNSDGTKVATVVNGKLTGWAAVPAAGEDGTITWPANTTLITDANGKISVDGLDADSYKLREIEALPGYNMLPGDVTFTVTAAAADTEDADKDSDTTELVYTTVVTEVENKSGTELPSTGGMGTTLFYVIGSVLALASVVLLVTKKRMSAAE